MGRFRIVLEWCYSLALSPLLPYAEVSLSLPRCLSALLHCYTLFDFDVEEGEALLHQQ